MLEALLLFTFNWFRISFAFRNSNSKYLAVGIAFRADVFNILHAITI